MFRCQELTRYIRYLDVLISMSPVSVLVIDRSLHAEQPRQDVDEDPPHPGRHGVSLRGAEVDIEDHHRHHDAAPSSTPSATLSS